MQINNYVSIQNRIDVTPKLEITFGKKDQEMSIVSKDV